MPLEHIRNFPKVPIGINSFSVVEEYLNRLNRALKEDQRYRPADIERVMQQTYAFGIITGITNDVIADSYGDTLTLATGNTNLSIVGTSATDTITFTPSLTPSYTTLTLTQETGTSPMTISSQTVVTNLNVDMLDGKHDTDFALVANAIQSNPQSGEYRIKGLRLSSDMKIVVTYDSTPEP